MGVFPEVFIRGAEVFIGGTLPPSEAFPEVKRQFASMIRVLKNTLLLQTMAMTSVMTSLRGEGNVLEMSTDKF